MAMSTPPPPNQHQCILHLHQHQPKLADTQLILTHPPTRDEDTGKAKPRGNHVDAIGRIQVLNDNHLVIGDVVV